MSNMAIWKDLSTPPDWAKKPIQAGRLKGKTDINPMWRYEAMTFQFGPCGEGWKYTIDNLWKEEVNGGCVLAFAQITLYIKNGDNWGDGIPGIGGNQMVQVEKAGLHSNDECYKMAVTDALSVACKMIGVGADVYKGISDSKYSNNTQSQYNPTPRNNSQPQNPNVIELLNIDQVTVLQDEIARRQGMDDITGLLSWVGKTWKYEVKEVADIRQANYKHVLSAIQKKPLKND